MPLMPKRVKYRKSQRGKSRGIALRGCQLNLGEFGLKSLENGWVTANQIEAVRVALTRQMQQGGRLFIRIFPDKSITKKPAETRQGKGKGEVDHWVAVVKRGAVLFELGGIPEELAQQVLRLAAYKLPLRTRFISRHRR